MNLTLDANIWVGYFDFKDSQHTICRELVKIIYSNPDITVFSPFLMEVEVLGSIARKFRDDPIEVEKITEARDIMWSLPRHHWFALDLWLSADASHCAKTCYLHGSDAVYVATAKAHETILLTYDKEIINRAAPILTVLTPNEWLKRYTKHGFKPEEQIRQGAEWIIDWKKLTDALDHTPVADLKSGIEILMEDRNRLEQPYSVPIGTVAKPPKKDADERNN